MAIRKMAVGNSPQIHTRPSSVERIRCVCSLLRMTATTPIQTEIGNLANGQSSTEYIQFGLTDKKVVDMAKGDGLG